MSDLFEPKFEVNGIYARDEFVFRMEVILTTIPDIDPFYKSIQGFIDWAKGHPDNYVFGFDTAQSGIIYPFARIDVIFPIVDPEQSQDSP